MAAEPEQTAGQWRAVILVTAGLTLARLVALFASPLELYPDEAQYWLWSRTLDFGYFSKPPMIAWSVWATTALGGDQEPWVRLSAPLYHAGATLAVYALGRRLYGPSAGFAAAALYMLMPGVQLSSMAVATDAPLLFFISLALLAYARFLTAEPGRRVAWAAAVGAAMGAALLSKYAAAYVAGGFALHAMASREARAAWRPTPLIAALGALALVVAPNLAWNAAHHFATFEHTAANAEWGGRNLFNIAELADFLGSQFGVFGPIPFAVLMGGAVVLASRRRLQSNDVMLLCFALPALLAVAVQAFISRANANWAAAGYVAGVVLAAAWLVRWRARRWLIAALALQAVLAALFLAWVVNPRLAEAMGTENSFKRSKGWAAMTDRVLERAAVEEGAGLSAVAVNDRFLFNAMAYYGRGVWRTPGAPPLVMWLRSGRAENQAEATDPLTVANGRRVLAVSLERVYRDEMAGDFTRVLAPEIARVSLDRKRSRMAEIFVGEGFSPRPRDPLTGAPIRP